MDSNLVDLFTAGTHGVHTFRLPSLVALGGSRMLVFAQGRLASRRDNAQAAVFVRRSTDDGRTWDAPRAVLRNASAAMVAQQALPASLHGDAIILLLNIIPAHVPCGPNRRHCGKCVTHMSRSIDGGETFSPPLPLPNPETFGSGVGNGLVLTTGRVLAPRRADCCDCSGEPKAYVLYSDDGGASWRAGARLAYGWTECSLAELGNGSIVLTARALHGRLAADFPGHRRLFARSDDGGVSWARTWAFAGTTRRRGGTRSDPRGGLADPDCFASLSSVPSAAAALSGGGVILYLAHPASSRRRANLSVHRSHDGGNSWRLWRRVYPGQSAYSALLAYGPAHARELAVAFERDQRYRHLSFMRLGRAT